ncbi:hypothetical protein CEUSTIGMA_g4160.t1 [Chlamydomonas eustigma]|uniref:AB hydrolase-1 domain-containing protein n=1 Tax=Chlamydomonas eustigma TaxID=1157962 RepID=A0A250X0T9_9CHLO|nr:hypothetical protein CEUSTIGMA_g4160.t1 [Chlamydomonas eustigma]|eukprot:GAX76714.1 hypothetical protein CEUSTIGMA_g4160.t1 [Chlamydomonas eustigma]
MDAAKRRKIDDQVQGSPVASLVLEATESEVLASHSSSNTFKYSGGLTYTDHYFRTVLDYNGEVAGEIDIFVREVVASAKHDQRLPCLLFLTGGPGFSCPRPNEFAPWIKCALSHFRVILLDQRGTGNSSPITVNSLSKKGSPREQAQYLSFFRADSIVRDAEMVRKTLVPSESYGGRWSVLGQSFGGFCSITYISIAPDSLIEVFITGGIPPDISLPCSAEAVYRALYRRVMLQNQRYYMRFPSDIAHVQKIVQYLLAQPCGAVRLPSGSLLTPRCLQLLGLNGLGMSGGFERLHFMLESFFDGEGEISPAFMKAFEAQMAWDSNPLYVLLHESIYCQGAASNWAAHRVRSEPEFSTVFDAKSSFYTGKAVYFTGEMVFPWMFEDMAYLRQYKEAADLVASKSDWGPLYNQAVLQKNYIPVTAAVYYEDMYVDMELSKPTADLIHGLRQWVTNEYRHSGIRDDGVRIFERLLNVARDNIWQD